MMIYLIIIMLIFIILFVMLMLNLNLSKKMYKNREKSSPFECGFDPLSKNRLPFSLSFYLITIIFLIFDVEIAMILPITYSNNYLFYLFYLNVLFILIILISGLYLEWKEGALKWFK